MSPPIDEPEDIIWQQRLNRKPSPREDAVGDALERIFDEGVEDLDRIVQRLNEFGLAASDGGPWSEDSFRAEMAELGRKEFGEARSAGGPGTGGATVSRTESLEVADPGAVEALLDLGLRNRWYPIAPSWMVGDKPVGLTRLGERIVVWRDGDGAAHVLADRCPHRGARLSMGWNLGDRLACWYHGIEVDRDGVVVDVPAVADCPLIGRKAVRSYPVFEHMGGIFVYFGDALHPEPVPFTLPEEFYSDEWDGLLCTAHWGCNYRYAVDNVMDPMHGTYLHAESHSMAAGAKEARMRVRPTGTGLMFEKTDQRGVNFDWVEFGDTGAHWLRLALPYRRNAGPGGLFGIMGFVTPIDADNCRVFFWRTRKCRGWQRDVWRFMYKNRLEGLHWDVLEQDRLVLEGMAADARDHEFLYQHDTGLARVRRLLRDEAASQVAALARAETAGAAAE